MNKVEILENKLDEYNKLDKLENDSIKLIMKTYIDDGIITDIDGLINSIDLEIQKLKRDSNIETIIQK